MKRCIGVAHRFCWYRVAIRPACLLLIFLAAACDDVPVTSVVFARDDVRSFAQGAMRDGPLPVVIAGRPDGVPEAMLTERVVAAMTQAMSWTATPRLRAAPAAEVARAIRIVVAFGGGGGGCGGQPGGGGPLADGKVALTMTLCAGEEALAVVSGRLGRSDGSEGPRFAALIRQATVDLFSNPRHP